MTEFWMDCVWHQHKLLSDEEYGYCPWIMQTTYIMLYRIVYTSLCTRTHTLVGGKYIQYSELYFFLSKNADTQNIIIIHVENYYTIWECSNLSDLKFWIQYDVICLNVPSYFSGIKHAVSSLSIRNHNEPHETGRLIIFGNKVRETFVPCLKDWLATKVRNKHLM